MKDPKWFWLGTFTDGSTVTFWADNKALAEDHAATLGFDVNKTLKGVVRLTHTKHLSAGDRAAAGVIRERRVTIPKIRPAF